MWKKKCYKTKGTKKYNWGVGGGVEPRYKSIKKKLETEGKATGKKIRKQCVCVCVCGGGGGEFKLAT